MTCDRPDKSSVAPAATLTDVVAGNRPELLALVSVWLFMMVCTSLLLMARPNTYTSSIKPLRAALPSPVSADPPIHS